MSRREAAAEEILVGAPPLLLVRTAAVTPAVRARHFAPCDQRLEHELTCGSRERMIARLDQPAAGHCLV
jgi:hypothetical protein